MLKGCTSFESHRYTVKTLGFEGEILDIVLTYPDAQAGHTTIVLKSLLKGVL